MPINPNNSLRAVAEFYVKDHAWVYGLDELIEGHYVKVDEERAERIAIEYNKLPDIEDSLHCQLAYRQLLCELIDQWWFLEDNGYEMEPWNQEGQPYANSAEMHTDVRENKHLWFFTGGEPHPYLNDVRKETGFTGNEMLRAVHDLFGHAAEGYGFGQRGEENAWIHHSMMFSELAQRALTTETRGQNCWVNSGPFKHLPASERPFADQKVALLPEWVADWREALNG